MIYNVAIVRRLFTKFQVNTCKTKKDRSAHAHLRQAMIYNAARVRKLSTKLQADTCKTKTDRSAHAHLVVEIQATIYNAASEGYLQYFKSIHVKLKKE